MERITIDPRQTALLVVDVQERLLPAMPAYDGKRLVACVELLVEAARLFRLPVLVTEQYTKGLGSTIPSVKTLLEGCSPTIAEKTVFSAMDPPEIPRALAASGARTVIVVGMEAHVCVFQTARELRARGYHTHLPFDAVASRDPACKQTALALLAQTGVHITTTETIAFDLLRDAKNEHFKALSARVKNLPMPGA